MYGLYPYHEITPRARRNSPPPAAGFLSRAATIARLGAGLADESVARLGDGNHAHLFFKRLLRPAGEAVVRCRICLTRAAVPD